LVTYQVVPVELDSLPVENHSPTYSDAVRTLQRRASHNNCARCQPLPGSRHVSGYMRTIDSS
jgi:hypothetical protein